MNRCRLIVRHYQVQQQKDSDTFLSAFLEKRAKPWRQNDFSVGVMLDEVRQADVTVDDQMAGVFQKTVFTVVQVPADLLYPRGLRTRRDASDLHT